MIFNINEMTKESTGSDSSLWTNGSY